MRIHQIHSCSVTFFWKIYIRSLSTPYSNSQRNDVKIDPWTVYSDEKLNVFKI